MKLQAKHPIASLSVKSQQDEDRTLASGDKPPIHRIKFL